MLRAARTQEMFLKNFRNIFCVQDTKFVSAINAAARGKTVQKLRNMLAQQCDRHNVSTFCRGLRLIGPRTTGSRSATWRAELTQHARRRLQGDNAAGSSERVPGELHARDARIGYLEWEQDKHLKRKTYKQTNERTNKHLKRQANVRTNEQALT